MKKIFTISILLALLTSACAASTETAATETPSTDTSDAASAEETGEEAQPTAAPFTDINEPCKSFNSIEFLLPPPNQNLPSVSETYDNIKGPSDAKMTIIEYSQFTCPACAAFDPILADFQEQNPNSVRLVFRHWLFQTNADLAAYAAQAAGNQGKFFEMKDVLFTNQAEWRGLETDAMLDYFRQKAEELGLDTNQFDADFEDEEMRTEVAAMSDAASGLGLGGTPSIFINGSLFSDNRSLSGVLPSLLKAYDLDIKGFEECPEVVSSGDYSALVETSEGDFNIELYADKAPYAVSSFIFLAENGWYEGNQIFFINDVYIITGDPTNSGFGQPGYAFLDENLDSSIFSEPGLVGMYKYRAFPGINGGMFFITKTSFEEINGMYTIFGKVSEGLDVVKALTSDSTILSITINKN